MKEEYFIYKAPSKTKITRELTFKKKNLTERSVLPLDQFGMDCVFVLHLI